MGDDVVYQLGVLLELGPTFVPVVLVCAERRLVEVNDMIFWVILAVLVLVNSVWEDRRGRERSLGQSGRSMWSFAARACSTAGVFRDNVHAVVDVDDAVPARVAVALGGNGLVVGWASCCSSSRHF